jgi:hypothetical protein
MTYRDGPQQHRGLGESPASPPGTHRALRVESIDNLFHERQHRFRSLHPPGRARQVRVDHRSGRLESGAFLRELPRRRLMPRDRNAESDAGSSPGTL